MDFFAQQERARRKTKWLVAYFVLAVAGVTGAVFVVASFAAGSLRESPQGGYQLGPSISASFQADVFGWASLATLTVMGLGTLWRLSELKSGGPAIASMLKGRRIRSNTADPDERKLLNVVEEMAIASGVPVPDVFLLPDESINAFAAGYQPGNAVVGVTRGGMSLLNREELQGVIAHEFSHILNGDMRLNLRLIAWIFGIMGLAIVGRILLRTRGRRNPLPLLGLALLLIGWCGVFFGRLIQRAVSRQREFLADASAVQFTRNPQGLASALKKIGGLGAGSRLGAPQVSEVSHLLFADGLKSSFLTPFATHPPLKRRILALDPSWDGSFPTVAPPAGTASPAPGATRPKRQPRIVSALPGAALAAPADSAYPRVGEPTPITLHYAAGWRDALSPAVEAAAREPFGAEALVFALLLSDDPAVRDRQISQLTSLADQPMADETLRLRPAVSALAIRARLPLVDLALPALRGLSEAQHELFDAALQALIEADQEIDLFEYTLQKVVRRHLDSAFTPARRKPAHYYVLRPLLPDCATVLKLLSHLGAARPAEAESAWHAGWKILAADPPQLPPPAADDLLAFDAALARLDLAVPPLKKILLTAAAHTVSTDGRIEEHEAELLRALADTLDCPIPPFVNFPAS